MFDPKLQLTCSSCGLTAHPSCLTKDDITEDMIDMIKSYPWQCADCRTCEACRSGQSEDLLFFCDSCLRGYHTFCVFPPLDEVPTGDWFCNTCKGQRQLTLPVKRGNLADESSPPKRRRKEKPHSPRLPIAQLALIANTIASPASSTTHMSTASPPPQPLTPKRPVKPIPAATPKLPTIKLTVKGSPKIVSIRPPPGLNGEGSSKGDQLAVKDHDTIELFYGGKLNAEEADTKKGLPGKKDRKRFDVAREHSKQYLPPSAHDHPEIEDMQSNDGEEGPAVKIKHVQFGDFEIDTWFASPYPEEFHSQQKLFLCEYCLKYMKSSYMLGRHKLKCPLTHPPGDEIYKDGIVSIFEVDGRKNKIYCQNLCLLVKMFLDHKTLYYDVEPFLFYVMTEKDDTGHHFVGYFSKEKRSAANYNLSCIMTLPIHQRKGYGNFLIDFSYLLSKKEGKPGSPEKPLSDLGLLSYRNYWRTVIMQELATNPTTLSIQELCERTCVTIDDIVSTLTNMDMIMKNAYGDYVIRYNYELITAFLDNMAKKNYTTVKPDLLRWSPFLFKAANNPPPEEVQEEEEEGTNGETVGDEDDKQRKVAGDKDDKQRKKSAEVEGEEEVEDEQEDEDEDEENSEEEEADAEEEEEEEGDEGEDDSESDVYKERGRGSSSSSF
ncbi:hypothetical protein SmJEL517_g01663 [Synchytrium microbalum]|uniref:Histone acetyltransferase n=1 Tax=Synchytrium microbalum TaxID=1806994 RepID=A0A507CA99_9FUNG|nr:uncharacterized protein SmJEL517_g01663 [Synchytrium microbalum]TPX36268.1 hypothetical protein SmJEL517_g01663 [Synchytrium microbalum]